MTVSRELIARAAARSAATLHEAGGRIGALPARIRPIAPGMTLTGPAYPVLVPGGDNLWLHHAIYAAAPGDVLVAATGAIEFGYWGEVMAVAALVRGLAGLVIDGGVRDIDRMAALGFPVFAAAIALRGTGKDPCGPGALGQAVAIGGVTITPGDLVCADCDGVVVLPADEAEAIVAKGERRDAEEEAIFGRLRAGETTPEIYALPTIEGAVP